MVLEVIRRFDPWSDSWCTCPKKYSLNPYTGCAHRCVYCYITSYIPRAFECRPKRNLLERVERDIRKIEKGVHVSMSNSSDPYPPLEAELRLTRGCLELFQKNAIPVQIITKSDLVVRDLEILKNMCCVVSFTITTMDERVRRKLEPGAPPSEKRLQAMRELAELGIAVTLRLDPVFPVLNEGEVEEIVEAAVSAGALHVTTSTFKPRADGWKRFSQVFPRVAEQIRDLYFVEGFRRHNAFYLPDNERRRLLEMVAKACQRNRVSVAFCREGIKFKAPSCDGSHLLGDF